MSTDRSVSRFIEFRVNGRQARIDADASMPVLWALRDRLGLKGTKYGCGVGACGICVVHVDGQPRLACGLSLDEVRGREVRTIEGLSPADRLLRAWIEEGVAQCGYCQPGQLMMAAALLARTPHPDDDEIDRTMSTVLCRCGSYQRVRRAIHRAAARADEAPAPRPRDREEQLPTTGHVWDLGPWVRIHDTGRVTVVIDRAEMGQGVVTALAALVAEELEVDLNQVETAFARPDPVYFNPAFGEQHTSGSNSIATSWLPLRRAGAQARERLRRAAADRWRVPIEQCVARAGRIVDQRSGRTLGYGELASEAVLVPAPQDVTLKDADAFHLLGRSLAAIDGLERSIGAVCFGFDVDVENCRTAVLARPPRPGAEFVDLDAAKSFAVPGVLQVVAVESGVAVVAEDSWAALRGRDALDIRWSDDRPSGPDDHAIWRQLREAVELGSGKLVRRDGDVASAIRRAATVLEVDYETPYLAHAAMEPLSCTVAVQSSGCQIWAPTQRQTAAQEMAARILGLPRESVRLHTTYLGGGFGRRLDQDFVAEAVQVARQVEQPVRLLWTRDDDLRYDLYRPANIARLTGALDATGRPIAWRQRVAGPWRALRDVYVDYGIANVEIELIESDPGIPTGAWRSVGSSQNAFAIESFVDELAVAGGRDPIELRLELLADSPRPRRVLELAADKAGWGCRLAEGWGRGVALFPCRGTWVAEVVEAFVSAAGEIRIGKVVCAVDCGFVINPDGVAAQIEGGVIFGLSAALLEKVRFTNGRAVPGNFREYPILPLRDAPLVEVHVVDSREPPTGVGEGAVPPIAPALANAIFAAYGVRVRKLPVRRLI